MKLSQWYYRLEDMGMLFDESVAHVLWDCPSYNIRVLWKSFRIYYIGSEFSRFLSLDSAEKTSFIMGSELLMVCRVTAVSRFYW